MGRTLTGIVAALGVMGALQSPVAEAGSWFHPIRAIEHVASDVDHAATRVGHDAVGAFAFQPNRAFLLGSLGLVAFGVGTLTGNPLLVGIGAGMIYANLIATTVRGYQYDRLQHGKDPGFSIGPVYIPSNLALDAAGANVGRNAATRSAAAYFPPSSSSGPNMGMHH